MLILGKLDDKNQVKTSLTTLSWYDQLRWYVAGPKWFTSLWTSKNQLITNLHQLMIILNQLETNYHLKLDFPAGNNM